MADHIFGSMIYHHVHVHEHLDINENQSSIHETWVNMGVHLLLHESFCSVSPSKSLIQTKVLTPLQGMHGRYCCVVHTETSKCLKRSKCCC